MHSNLNWVMMVAMVYVCCTSADNPLTGSAKKAAQTINNAPTQAYVRMVSN
jgi:hypothetical protein